jgi:hypothetical protein
MLYFHSLNLIIWYLKKSLHNEVVIMCTHTYASVLCIFIITITFHEPTCNLLLE